MRVLALTHRLPYQPNRGDRIRTYYMLRHIAPHFDIDLVSLVHDADEASHAHDLDALGIRTHIAQVPYLANRVRGTLALPGRTPLTHYLLASPHVEPVLADLVAARPPDVVLAYCSSMARYALTAPLDGYPLVLDMIDVDSAKWQILARDAAPPKQWIYAREHRTLSAFERRAATAAATTLVVNDRERDVLGAIAPGASVHVLQNGVDVESFRPARPPAEAPVAVFAGMMDYGPNEAGAIWAARQVWPLVVAARPDAKLIVLGANPTPAVRALAGPSVDVTGSVPDTRPYLWQSAVGLAPLQVARGIQNKVLEAVAAGLPTVVTREVAAGLPGEVAPACVMADSPEAFAHAVLRLFAMTPAERRETAGRARLEPLTWAARLTPLAGMLERAAARQPFTAAG